MKHWRFRLIAAALLSVLLLPLGLVLKPDLTYLQLLGLLGLGILTTAWIPAFRALVTGTLLCAGLLLVWLFSPIAPWLTQRLVDSDPPKAVDLIVILGGGMQCGSGHLEASSLGRLVSGLELWKAGYAPRISLTDTADIFGDPNCPSIADVASRITRSLFGQAPPEVVILQEMRTTRTEAMAVAEVVKQRNFRRVMVVTAPTHTRRACGTFRQLGLEVVCVAALEPRFDMALRKPSDRLDALYAVMREYLGLGLYWLRGWL